MWTSPHLILRRSSRFREYVYMDSYSEEEWRPVPGYEGLYEITRLGRVRRLRSTRGVNRVLTPAIQAQPGRQPYAVVTLCRNSKARRVKVHRLIALTFHGLPAEGQVCRHLNGNSLDNRPENLAWGTYSENTIDQVLHGVHNMASKTHCKRDHEFTPENTYYNVRSDFKRRVCRRCQRDRMREKRASGAYA